MPPQRHLPLAARQSQGRQRGRKACLPCRKRKIKCDEAEPCAGCSTYGYECVYDDNQPASRATSARAVPVSPSKPYDNDMRLRAIHTPSSLSEHSPAKTEIVVMGEEILGPTREGQGHLFLPLRTRYTSAYSACVWPKILGKSLDMVDPPRLHPFAWNPGLRAEDMFAPQTSICNIISLHDMKRFADVYFEVVHPYFNMLDYDIFHERAGDMWEKKKIGLDFECVVCYAAALGSYFSDSVSASIEAQLVEQGRLLLEFSVARPPALLSLKHVVGWVLRAIYLRLTTRPHLSWMASCNAVHVAEAIGLHRNIVERILPPELASLTSPYEERIRKSTFWLAMGLNKFLAAEYGRTRVDIDFIGHQPRPSQPGDHTAEMIAILLSVPRQRDCLEDPSKALDALRTTVSLSADSPLLHLLRADAVFCLFRLLRSSGQSIPESDLTLVLDIISNVVDQAKVLADLRQPWWNVIGTPFHSICILLSIGTSTSYMLLPKVVQTLRDIVDIYNTDMSREALKTAYNLIQGAMDKRVKDQGLLEQGLKILGESLPDTAATETPSSARNFFELPTDDDLGFFKFLDYDNYFAED